MTVLASQQFWHCHFSPGGPRNDAVGLCLVMITFSLLSKEISTWQITNTIEIAMIEIHIGKATTTTSVKNFLDSMGYRDLHVSRLPSLASHWPIFVTAIVGHSCMHQPWASVAWSRERQPEMIKYPRQLVQNKMQ